MKKIISVFVVLLVFVGVYVYWQRSLVVAESCFALYSESGEDSDLSDYAFLRYTETGEQVAGSLATYPAEKDSMDGTFSGVIIPGEPARIESWYSYTGEGLNIVEQKFVQIGADSATIGYGEMVEEESGRYVYRYPAEINYQGFVLPQVSCAEYDDLYHQWQQL